LTVSEAMVEFKTYPRFIYYGSSDMISGGKYASPSNKSPKVVVPVYDINCASMQGRFFLPFIFYIRSDLIGCIFYSWQRLF
jgi:hypothetical protein